MEPAIDKKVTPHADHENPESPCNSLVKTLRKLPDGKFEVPLAQGIGNHDGGIEDIAHVMHKLMPCVFAHPDSYLYRAIHILTSLYYVF